MARTKQIVRKPIGCFISGPRAQLSAAAARKSAPASGAVNKPRNPPGTAALNEIIRLQDSTELVIPKAAVERLIREIAQDHMSEIFFQKDAIEALQEAAEDYMVKVLAQANKNANHRGHPTIMVKDLKYAEEILRIQPIPFPSPFSL